MIGAPGTAGQQSRPTYNQGKTPEGVLKADVMRHLRLRGWFVEINVQGIHTKGKARGRPDLEASKRGITIRIETKAPDHWTGNRHYPEGKLRPEQVEYIRVLAKHGIVTIVTADLEGFVKDLDTVEERYWPGQSSKRLF